MRRARRERVTGGQGRRQGLSRREFLAGTTAAGVAASVPLWLLGCGDDGDGSAASTPTPVPTATPTPASRPRETRTLHYDLSYGGVEELQLVVIGSPSHRMPLALHTDATRARFRASSPALADVPDEQLTHYAEALDLPADALQMVWVTGTLAETGEAVLAGMHIHIPAEILQNRARAAAERGQPLRWSGKLRGLDGETGGTPPIDLLPAINGYVSPYDTAVALVFQQSEIMNLNPDQAAEILNLIETLPCEPNDPQCTPFLATLAVRIAEAWPATESGFTTFNGQQVKAWAQLVPVSDPDGNPVLDSQGKQALRCDVDEDIAKTAVAVAAPIKRALFNDDQYAGLNWHPTQGLTVRQVSGQAALGGPAGAAELALTAEHDAGTTTHGVKFERIAVTDPASRTVEVDVRNNFLRYVSAYVQFANEGGDLPVPNPDEHDTTRAKHLQTLNANYTVMGIPLLGDLVELQTLSFDVPAEASKARIYFGSLGLGGDPFCPEALRGSVATLIFNIGLPTIFLAAGVIVSATLQRSITTFLRSSGGQASLGLIALRIAALAGPAVANGIFGTNNSKSATPLLSQLGTAAISVISSSSEWVSVYRNTAVELTTEETADCVPVLGVALRIAAIAGDVATIAESVGEVLASPALFTNTLALSMTTTVVISKDPNDFQFPARARAYEVTLIYDQASKLAHKLTGAIDPGRVDPISVVFDAVPSGGMVTADVVLKTDDDWIVGRSTGANGMPGPVGPFVNTAEAAGTIAITIKEQLIPLTAQTRYLHDLKLEYQDGHHVWVETAAPQATRAGLCQGLDDRLCDLTAITVSQRTGMVGYSWQAGGQGVPFCGETSSGIMFVLQNLFLAENPDRALKQVSCGFHSPVGILYDKLGAADGSGRNFFLQPKANGFFLQSVTLDDTTPFGLDNALTWGEFSQALDSLAVHPMGFVVGVNRTTHKMEILQLPPQPVDAQQAPHSVPFAAQKSGAGTRAGLMLAPVAVTVRDGTILVLEDGNTRIQAFDTSGNPVNLFRNKTTSIVELSDAGTAVYVDLAVEGLGYMYVLSYLNDGLAVSDYRVDIYTPQGNFLTRTTGVAAARLAVDTFRNLYTLNYEAIAGAPRVEPSLSQWAPSSPDVS